MQHLLLARELLGDSRREPFVTAARDLDAAFRGDPDPLARDARNPNYDRLFTRIVRSAPAPVGAGR